MGKSFGELYEGIKTAEIQVPCRRFEDFEYRTRKSWSRARRVVGKAEILDKGQNPRFVVTNLPAEGFAGEPVERFAARPLYEKLYCARGLWMEIERSSGLGTRFGKTIAASSE